MCKWQIQLKVFLMVFLQHNKWSNRTVGYLVLSSIVFCWADGCGSNCAAAGDSYEHRLNQLIEQELAGEFQSRQQDVYGKGAALRLVCGVDVEAANKTIKEVAEWFEHPHPRGRALDGEPDFTAYSLSRVYCLAKDSNNLYPDTKAAIERFFTEYDSKSIYPSENHYLLWRSSRYLMAAILGAPVGDTSGKGGGVSEAQKTVADAVYGVHGEHPTRFNIYRDEATAIEIEDKHWLRAFLRYRARRGWGEFDSTIYMIAQFECLMNLYDFAPDKQIKELAKVNLDMLVLGMALNSVDGIYGGAQGRGAVLSRFDHKQTNVYAMNYLYFGNCSAKGTRMVVLYGSDYRPPSLIVKLAKGTRPAYANRERKHLHNVVDGCPYEPLEGSIRKYTFVTPSYIMGCVQFQDDYPQGHAGAWYANHSQHQWDLSFVGDTQLRVFAGHPVGEGDKAHGSYWAGGTGHFFQQRNALVALYDIGPEKRYQMIHAYFPRKRFDEVVEKEGWVFGRYGNAAVGLRFSNPCRWVEKGKYANMEIISDGNKHAVVCEARSLDEISFEGFIDELIGNKVVFDEGSMELSYSSKAEGVLEINTKGKRRHNGKNEDLNYPSYGSPYAHSKWDSGIVEINFDGEELVLDSNK